MDNYYSKMDLTVKLSLFANQDSYEIPSAKQLSFYLITVDRTI